MYFIISFSCLLLVSTSHGALQQIKQGKRVGWMELGVFECKFLIDIHISSISIFCKIVYISPYRCVLSLYQTPRDGMDAGWLDGNLIIVMNDDADEGWQEFRAVKSKSTICRK